MPSGKVGDISRMLFVSFQSGSSAPVGKSDLTRFWSLEMHWMKPLEASSLVDALVNSGWLIGDSSSLFPNHKVELTPPELGWQPLLRDFREVPDPPEAYEGDMGANNPIMVENSEEKTPFFKPEKTSENDEVEDLIRYISRSSGLGREEVLRRAKRKIRALNPLSLGLALALVAREQHLEMPEVIAMLESD